MSDVPACRIHLLRFELLYGGKYSVAVVPILILAGPITLLRAINCAITDCSTVYVIKPLAACQRSLVEGRPNVKALGDHLFVSSIVFVFSGEPLVHKTFHRYVVRAKAGTAQSQHDKKGKQAQSAGAQIRRHNEAALAQVPEISVHVSYEILTTITSVSALFYILRKSVSIEALLNNPSLISKIVVFL